MVSQDLDRSVIHSVVSFPSPSSSHGLAFIPVNLSFLLLDMDISPSRLVLAFCHLLEGRVLKILYLWQLLKECGNRVIRALTPASTGGLMQCTSKGLLNLRLEGKTGAGFIRCSLEGPGS